MSVAELSGIDNDVAPEKLVMDDGDPLLDEYFLDLPAGFLEEPVCQNQDDCPPPLFLLPPPPRPPEMGDSCSSLSPYESCDNIIIIDSQIQLEETFQNLIIVAVCSAVLVIALVLLVACVWRKRKSNADGCHCSDGKSTAASGSSDANTLGADSLEMKSCGGNGGLSSEVYDNPNYSHIIIGGKPFFILPTGELSEHVPVPTHGEQLSPRHQGSPIIAAGNLTSPGSHAAVIVGNSVNQQHIYEGGGSSTYRSGSDYETESSTYRPDSDRASNGGQGGSNGGGNNGFPPIYEEIDKNTLPHSQYTESQFGGTPSAQHIVGLPPSAAAMAALVTSDNKGFVRTMAVNHRGVVKPEDLPHGASPLHLPPHLVNNSALHSDNQSWTSKSLSPRRPPTSNGGGGRMPHRTSDSNNSVYYYSDTLRRRPAVGNNGSDSFISAGGRESIQESDSGVSSGRSGHNTSSESTPQPRFELNRSLRGNNSGLGPPAIRGSYPVVSSEEDISLDITGNSVGMRRLPMSDAVSRKILPASAGNSNSPARRQLPTPEHYPSDIPPRRQPLPSQQQSWQQSAAAAGGFNNGNLPIDTEIVVRNTSRREPRAHL